MRVAVSTGLYYKKGYEEILDIIEASDCDNIELFLNQAMIDVPLDVLEKAISQRGLKVSSIHSPLCFIAYDRNETEAYWIEKGIEYLERFKADVLVSHFFRSKDDASKNNDASHFANMAKYRNNEGVMVCTENMPNLPYDSILKDSDRLVTFLKENGSYMTYDVAHSASNGRSIIDDYNLFKDYIRNIHLSDYVDGKEHKALGYGDLPLKELLLKLKADAYNHAITLELDFDNPNRNIVENNEEAVRLINHSVDYIYQALA